MPEDQEIINNPDEVQHTLPVGEPAPAAEAEATGQETSPENVTSASDAEHPAALPE